MASQEQVDEEVRLLLVQRGHAKRAVSRNLVWLCGCQRRRIPSSYWRVTWDEHAPDAAPRLAAERSIPRKKVGAKYPELRIMHAMFRRSKCCWSRWSVSAPSKPPLCPILQGKRGYAPNTPPHGRTMLVGEKMGKFAASSGRLSRTIGAQTSSRRLSARSARPRSSRMCPLVQSGA
jgi:hypothetical protein